MDPIEVSWAPATRRAFLRASGVTFVGGSAMFLAACGGDSGQRDDGRGAPGTTDVDILNGALDLENTAIAAYTAGTKLLRGDALALGRKFLAQEQEHAAGLEHAIRQIGGTPHVPRSSYADVIGNPQSQTAVLEFVNMIENTAVQAYMGAIPKLTDPKLRATAAAIVTNEAEHISLLRGALGLIPIPSAFVSGREV